MTARRVAAQAPAASNHVEPAPVARRTETPNRPIDGEAEQASAPKGFVHRVTTWLGDHMARCDGRI
jgi:hypothetical protein